MEILKEDMTVDLTKLSDTQLKALCYDLLQQKLRAESDIRLIESVLSSRPSMPVEEVSGPIPDGDNRTNTRKRSK